MCTTPWTKDCSDKVEEGEELCQTVYQSECFTKQTVHEVSIPSLHLVLPRWRTTCLSAGQSKTSSVRR